MYISLLKVYHGTISSCAENIIKNGNILKKGKPKVDFGQGFYTTNSYSFAKSTAKNKAEKTNLHLGERYVVPVVLKFNVDKKLLNNLNILNFTKEDIKWAQFIINNRNGFDYMKEVGSHFHNLKQKFDIVIGGIADNQISLLSKELKTLNKKANEIDLHNMRYSYHTKQMSFHTTKSLSCLELVDCDIIIENKQKGDVVNE